MAQITEYSDAFELPSEGKHIAVLVRFVDLGLQPSRHGASRNAELAFELADETTAGGGPMLAFKRVFNLSSRSKNFRETVRAVSNMHDISSVNTKDLVGKWCEIVIEHVTTEDGSTYANLDCRPLKGKAPTSEPVSELVFFSLHPSEFHEEDLKELSERQREKIKASETYKTLIADLKGAAKGKPAAEIIDDDFPENLGGAPKSKKRAA